MEDGSGRRKSSATSLLGSSNEGATATTATAPPLWAIEARKHHLLHEALLLACINFGVFPCLHMDGKEGDGGSRGNGGKESV